MAEASSTSSIFLTTVAKSVSTIEKFSFSFVLSLTANVLTDSRILSNSSLVNVLSFIYITLLTFFNKCFKFFSCACVQYLRFFHEGFLQRSHAVLHKVEMIGVVRIGVDCKHHISVMNDVRRQIKTLRIGINFKHRICLLCIKKQVVHIYRIPVPHTD